MGHVKLILVSARYALHVRLCCLAGIVSKLHIILVKTHLIPGGVGRLPYYLIYSQSIAHLLKYIYEIKCIFQNPIIREPTHSSV